MNFYYYSLCHVCKKPSPNLKKCSSCKILHYCSREHQLQDWPKHKRICKIITKTNEFLVFPSGGGPQDFNHYKYTSALLWQCEMGRTLKSWEHQLWMYPKVCVVCYSRDVTIICQTCQSVAYCSEEHKNSHTEYHQKWCNNLKLCLMVQQYVFSNEVPESFDWFVIIDNNVRFLPENINGVLRMMGYHAEPGFSKKYMKFICMTEQISPVANMIYALEKSGFIENRFGRNSKLAIHIVGASHVESTMYLDLVLEMLFHWIINLKKIKIVQIGPEVDIEYTLNRTLDCDECREKNAVGTLTAFKGFYHNLLPLIGKPDLVIAFNSGLHEFINAEQDTWKKSIPKLLRFRGVPTLLTAYTEAELTNDIARFQGLQFNFLVEPQRNPYRNIKPIRNWEEGSDPIFFQNNYIAIITKN